MQPRLGPKPFTPPKLQNYSSNLDKVASSEPNSFDKVFSVPQAPQKPNEPSQEIEKPQNNEIPDVKPETTNSEVAPGFDYEKLTKYESEANDFSKLTENSKIYEKNSLELGKTYAKSNDVNLNHGNIYEKIENDLEKPLKKVPNDENVDKKKKSISPVKNGEADDEDYLPKTPSLADRRKLFETGRRNSGSEEKEQPDGVTSSKSVESFKDEDHALERGSGQRNSIAERRRVYENRSVSVQDQGVTVDKTSPTPLRRKGSFKTKHEETVVEEPVNRRATIGGPVKAVEKTAEKKDFVAPTPKRTSTVFGE